MKKSEVSNATPFDLEIASVICRIVATLCLLSLGLAAGIFELAGKLTFTVFFPVALTFIGAALFFWLRARRCEQHIASGDMTTNEAVDKKNKELLEKILRRYFPS